MTSYCKEFIRPKAVNDALHYSDIQCNGKWSENSKNNEQLWNAIHIASKQGEKENASDTDTSDDDSVNLQEITDSEEDIEKDIPSDVADNLHLKRSINSSTCLYPEQGPSVRSNKILNIAPAEGQIPTSVFHQEIWETLAFSRLFPDRILFMKRGKCL
jgi:hypothetical protein